MGCAIKGLALYSSASMSTSRSGKHHKPPQTGRRKLPRKFKDLTPTNAFNPRTFFHEMVWKALLMKRSGKHKKPTFPKLEDGQVAIAAT